MSETNTINVEFGSETATVQVETQTVVPQAEPVEASPEVQVEVQPEVPVEAAPEVTVPFESEIPPAPCVEAPKVEKKKGKKKSKKEVVPVREETPKVEKTKKGKKKPAPEPVKVETPKKRGPTPKKDSCLAAVATVLSRTNKSLKIREIWERIQEKKLWTTDAATPMQTMSGAIQLEIKKKGTESRFARGEEKATFRYVRPGEVAVKAPKKGKGKKKVLVEVNGTGEAS